jgi:hypothetical protein
MDRNKQNYVAERATMAELTKEAEERDGRGDKEPNTFAECSYNYRVICEPN